MQVKQVVQQFYQEFGAGNLDGAFALLADNVVWKTPESSSIPYFGRYTGVSGVGEFLPNSLKSKKLQSSSR